MRRFPTVLVLLLASSLPFPLLASEHVVTLDPEATTVTFDLPATGHDVHGTLYLRSGEIHLDEESGAASGAITIDVVRSETGNKKRDKTMHAKVLHSAENPWIVFEAQRMEGTLAEPGASDVKLVGTLTLVGSEHPFTLPMAVELDQEGHFTAHTSFSIPYVEWGLENPSIAFLRVAKEVEVSVDAKGALKADGAATMSAGSEQP